ncbi:MAG: protein of unknown function YeeE/YedE [Chloroflexi bacterium]|jgi:hypothetical protein|nr:protein of unknown function YeeE/YedE [Chloroflexota bacterium]
MSVLDTAGPVGTAPTPRPGVASFSLHGWIWCVMALAGTALGVSLRPLFGLTNPRPGDSTC